MNRRSFLTRALIALGLGFLAPKRQLSAITRPFDRGEGERKDVGGVPIFHDPYVPTDKIFIFGYDHRGRKVFTDYRFTDYQHRDLPRVKALQYIVGHIKIHGVTPEGAVVNKLRWDEIA
jgi:hypothetical protein